VPWNARAEHREQNGASEKDQRANSDHPQPVTAGLAANQAASDDAQDYHDQ
jgi:hypothetical protein